ncbi:hypothetical protein JCM10213_008207 [Rhodosporidiobolus nylandii]
MAHSLRDPYSPLRVPSPTPQTLPTIRKRFAITDLTVRIPSSRTATSSAQQPPPPSRWRTNEFYAYYVVFAVVVPWMWRAGCRASSATNPLYWKYQHRLQEGWLFGWRVDTTDHQYHLFRSFLPLLLALAILHLFLSRTFRRLFTPSRGGRARFSALFSCALLVALHGTSASKIALIMGGNWVVVKKGCAAEGRKGKLSWKREWTPYAIWAYNVGVLFLNELTSGWRFGAVHPCLSFLDSHPGLLPRWHISWNISMLRLVSWGMEYYWASSPSPAPELPTSPQQKAAPTPTRLPPTPTLSTDEDYTPSLYISYVLYPPLYLAGPIMSYPSYLSQLSPASSSPTPASPNGPSPATEPVDETTPRALLSYAFRFAACLLTMELLLHSMYPVAIKDSGAGWWNEMRASEVAMVGFWNLVVVWLKLLLPWRLFRLWSLCDGVVPPENMVRCMANNYSTGGFWRSWHRSYNLWVIRYLYIPLGGSSRPLLATLGVFTFVALWHDLRLRLLVWGWAVTLFIAPEMLARKVVPASKYSPQPWYRPLAALGGVANILLMMTANLVGFVLGLDGAREVWGRMVGGWEGRIFLLTACACLFVAVQVMFEYREEERRRGIDRKC